MPSHWKICSTMTLPEMRYGMVRPRSVIIGIRALRKAWRHSTADGAAPFARAVVMKSWRMTSDSADFEKRAKMASCA